METLKRVGVIGLILALVGWFAYSRTLREEVPRPPPIPLVGSVGSSATQVQQREFDDRLESVNHQAATAYADQVWWEKKQDLLGWAALVVHILLVAAAWITGKPAPGGEAGGAAPPAPAAAGSPRRSFGSWVMLILAILAFAIQAVDGQCEKKKIDQIAIVKHKREAAGKARIAFADAKNDKEYEAAIDIARNAEVGIYN